MGQKTKLFKNIMSNVGGNLVTLFIGLFMTPFLIGKLGKDAYGIIPIVNSCVAFLVLASGGIRGALNRYVTLYFSKGQFDIGNQYINTAFFIILGIVSIVAVPFAFFSAYLPDILTIPENMVKESKIVFMFLGLSIFVEILSSPLTVGNFYKQRFDLANLLSVAKQVLHAAIIFIIFIWFSTNIVVIAVSTFVTTCLSATIAIWISKTVAPDIRFAPGYFDRTKIRDIFCYSVWTLLIQISFMMLINTDFIIVNKFLGTAAVTDYSLAAKWNRMVRNISMSAIAVITPMITSLEADQQFEKIRQVNIRGIRLFMIFIIPCTTLLTVFSKELLTIWVGHEFVHNSILFWYSVLPLMWVMTELPSSYILRGLGKVKWIALSGIVSAVLNVVFSVILVHYYSMGTVGVALGTAISLSIKSLVFFPLYMQQTLGIPILVYYFNIVKPVVVTAPVWYMAYQLSKHIHIDGWASLILVNVFCVACYLLVSYACLLTLKERQGVISYLKTHKVFRIFS